MEKMKRADKVGIGREALLAERRRRRAVQRELAQQRRRRGLSLSESMAAIVANIPNVKGDR
jgi:hypothetical protein